MARGSRRKFERAGLERRFGELGAPVLGQARVRRMDDFVQHGNTSTLDHTVEVAWMSVRIACRLGIPVDQESLVRGAILHDYFLYDWHVADPERGRLHGFRHPGFALRNASRDFDLTDIEKDLIRHHMFPLTPSPPRSREAVLVCVADKICSVRETVVRDAYRGHAVLARLRHAGGMA